MICGGCGKGSEDAGELGQSAMMAVRERCQQGVVRRVEQRMHNVLDAGQNEVVGRGQGHREFCREPRQGVTNALGAGIPKPDSVTPVGVEGRARVPAVGAMRGPSGAIGGLDMDKNTDTWWGQRRSIKVNSTMELCVGRKVGIDARALKEVEREFGLR